MNKQDLIGFDFETRHQILIELLNRLLKGDKKTVTFINKIKINQTVERMVTFCKEFKTEEREKLIELLIDKVIQPNIEELPHKTVDRILTKLEFVKDQKKTIECMIGFPFEE